MLGVECVDNILFGTEVRLAVLGGGVKRKWCVGHCCCCCCCTAEALPHACVMEVNPQAGQAPSHACVPYSPCATVELNTQHHQPLSWLLVFASYHPSSRRS